MLLAWDASRSGARGGVRLTWDAETGWFYAKLGSDTREVLLEAPSRRCTASSPPRTTSPTSPKGLVHHWRTPDGEYGAEWHRAPETRTAIEEFRQLRAT
jgi:hypothetical protein